MRSSHKMIGLLWMGICAYFCASLLQGLHQFRSDRLLTLSIDLFFTLLFLAGAIISFYVIIGARWAQVFLAIVALLTVTASVMGLFAFFNSDPFSVIGLALDTFALASAGMLFFVRRDR